MSKHQSTSPFVERKRVSKWHKRTKNQSGTLLAFPDDLREHERTVGVGISQPPVRASGPVFSICRSLSA